MPRLLQNLALCSAGALIGGWAIRSGIRSWRSIDFRNRVVLITGGSRGLGVVLARQLARQEAKVAICARDSGELHRAEEQLRQWTPHVFARVCDIARQEEAHSLVDHVEQELGPIDILINNAGTICVGPVESMLLEDYQQAMDTHFWGPLYTIHRVLPSMKRRGFGRIVNIASIGGKISVPHLVPYCASKFALVGLSRGLRAELAKDGIHVTTVSPGLMRTGSPRHAWFKGRHRLEYTWFSISDSLPPFSMNAERAARKILNACQHGDAELVLSIPAKLAVLFDTLAPELSAEIMALVNSALPSAEGGIVVAKKGYASQSALSPSFLTTLNEQAARDNNELTPQRQ